MKGKVRAQPERQTYCNAHHFGSKKLCAVNNTCLLSMGLNFPKVAQTSPSAYSSVRWYFLLDYVFMLLIIFQARSQPQFLRARNFLEEGGGKEQFLSQLLTLYD